ncbi:hypothetical protein [Streptacidiphilus neutrinimicus]|uniref:hypothetical protein n=1 Tax=Streptacidiphilus neutrinimicus TaxID=105420 RepID=UPI0005A9BBFB|nr:hypothetical protein [Streptacidiphilus neutrinimicus]
MLVDSFSFTHDETAASVDSQAHLLVEAGWQLPRPRRQAARPCTGPHSCGRVHDEDELVFDDTERTGY